MNAYAEDLNEMVSQMEEGIPLSPTHRRMAALEAGSAALRAQDMETFSSANAMEPIKRAHQYDDEAFIALQDENIKLRQALANALTELEKRAQVIGALRIQISSLQDDIEAAVRMIEAALRT